MKKVYFYEARDESGNLKKGEVEGFSVQEVAAALHEKNYFIASIQEKRGFICRLQRPFLFNPALTRQVPLFCRQLSIMLGSGLPLLDAVAVLLRQTRQPGFREIIAAIGEDLEQGWTLTAAMRRHGRVFSEVVLSMVEAGETGGVLDETLERLAVHLERERKVKEKAKTALVYPMFVLAASLIMLTVLLLFVLPVFVKIFAGMRMELPLPTRLLIEFSCFLQEFFWLILLGGGGAGCCAAQFIAKHKAVCEQILCKIPVVGGLMIKTATARFARTLGTLLQGGLPLLIALEASKKVTGYDFFVHSLDCAVQRVKDGASFSAALEERGLFAPMVTQVIAVGEETGKMDVLLGKLADYYENEVEEAALRLNNLFEPVIVLVLGVFVGGIVLAVLLPLFDSIMYGLN